MLTLHLLDWERVDWVVLDHFADRTVYQTRPWLLFLAKAKQAEPVIAEVRDGDSVCGYFTGVVLQQFGLRILGSPFPGCTTAYMGFNLAPGYARREAFAALTPFAFDTLKCMHIEVMDRHATAADGEDAGFAAHAYRSMGVDLRPSEEEIFRRMEAGTRQKIRAAGRNGVTIEPAHDPGFVEEYYAQLQDVFAKQRLVPTYPLDRVRALIEYLLPTGHLLLLRARDRDGRCIATGIFPAMNEMMSLWGCASWRATQHLRPNEALQWEAMRYWKQRGIPFCDMNGYAPYKTKYGTVEFTVPWFRKTKYRSLTVLRDAARLLYRWTQHAKGASHAIRPHPETPSTPGRR